MKFQKLVKAEDEKVYKQSDIKEMQECFKKVEKYLYELSEKVHNDQISINHSANKLSNLAQAMSSVNYELEQAARNLPDWKSEFDF